MSSNKRLARDSSGVVDYWVRPAVISSLLLVLFVTLFPYDFSHREIRAQFGQSPNMATVLMQSSWHDFIENILLYLPLGFSLSCWGLKTKLRRFVVFGMTLAFATSLSLATEILQSFLPSRVPSLNDIIANIIGASLSFSVFGLMGSKISRAAVACLEWTRRFLSRKMVTVGLLSYIGMMFFISVPLQRASSFHNWDKTFHLLLGNEGTGDRPWRGYIYLVLIFDKAIKGKEVERALTDTSPLAYDLGAPVAKYEFIKSDCVEDFTSLNPKLVWVGDSLKSDNGSGIFLGPTHWQKSLAPAEDIIQKLSATDQFTIITSVATADTGQTGPARIISLSSDPYHRNFTIAQEGNNLIFRLRTPVTGENGTEPELVVPNVFGTTKPRHLVFSYDGSRLFLYVNGVRQPHSLDFSPGAVAAGFLFSLDPFDMLGYKILFYMAVLFPLGLLLMLTVWLGVKRLLPRIVLICGIILLYSLVLEVILAEVARRSLCLENLFLSMLITAGGMLMSAIAFRDLDLKSYASDKPIE